MRVDSIKNGFVIDHITAGNGMKIYDLLKLGELSCPVALMTNVKSAKMGVKDIIKIDADVTIDMDILGYVDPNVTIDIIKDEKLNKEFIDTDQEIERRENRTIPEIFASSGEEYFRKVESQVLKDVGKLAGKIISTGGGVVKNKDNYFPLMQNGKIFWIDRNVESLVTDGRPLSKDLETVKKLYLERKDNYAFFADEVIKNDTTVEDAVKGVIDLL